MTTTAVTTGPTPAEADLPADHLGRRPHPRAPDALAGAAPGEPRDRGPKVVREKLSLHFSGGHYGFTRNDARREVVRPLDLRRPGPAHRPPARRRPASRRSEQQNVPAIYEDFREATYDQKARLVDMDTNHVEVAINYPNTFPRFAGQGFAERADKDLSLQCVQIYNDWMIDEWCGGDGRGG